MAKKKFRLAEQKRFIRQLVEEVDCRELEMPDEDRLAEIGRAAFGVIMAKDAEEAQRILDGVCRDK